ncbi:MAG: dipeptidase [Bacillota bacterium]|jgi:membrane dipeptidase
MYYDDMSLSFSGSFPFRADGHCDTLTAMKDGRNRHIDPETLARYMDLQFMALFVEEDDAVKAAAVLDELYLYYRTLLTEEYGDLWIPLKNGDSFARLDRDNIGVILALENCSALAVAEDEVYDAYDKGFRSFGIVWNGRNNFGAGALSEGGLTAAGERLLRTLNRLPAAVDLAHMNERTFFDALDVLEYPPIVTHAGCGLVHPHVRNLTEDQMKELRQAGGIMGITFVSQFLGPDPANVGFDDIIDHVLYASDYVGIDHIAFGSDFDGADLPDEMTDVSRMAALYRRMRERDFSEAEVRMIAGENLLGYMKATLSREET